MLSEKDPTADTYSEQAYQDELKDIQNFCTIAEQVPHLGQFLLNLEYFNKAHLLTSTQYTELINLFNISMRNNNLWLKIYVPIKYQLE